MKVIVAGAGTLGRRVTRYVSAKHEVTIIEQNPARFAAVT
jgi:Trk K+ transport system NAD-binding subunit